MHLTRTPLTQSFALSNGPRGTRTKVKAQGRRAGDRPSRGGAGNLGTPSLFTILLSTTLFCVRCYVANGKEATTHLRLSFHASCVLVNSFLCNVPILQMPHWLQGYSPSSVKLYASFAASRKLVSMKGCKTVTR